MDQCPHCNKAIPSGCKYCPECGEKLSLFHRALDGFGGTIPELFCFVRDHTGPLGNILGFIVIMIYVIAVILIVGLGVSVIWDFIRGEFMKESLLVRIGMIVMLVGCYPLITWLVNRGGHDDSN